MVFIKTEKKTRTAVVLPICREKDLRCDDLCGVQLQEAINLVDAMGQKVVFSEAIFFVKPVAATFFGRGTVERLKTECLNKEVELLVVDGRLSPVQQRNLEEMLQVKVIDRTSVILEIFGKRAQTSEGKLQVELAHLTYQRGRLVRSWTHLERQRGGGGFLGGPGETQIELDRRQIDNRIIKIKKDLEKVKRTRAIQRVAREKGSYPTVALVGYTNAGKSTLFNYVSKANVFVRDMLFATLDPTMRQVNLGQGLDVIFSDTVGFISHLPHELIMAFRATLEEVLEADVILHVIDVSNPRYKKYREDVLHVLHELGLENIESTSRYMEVYNKTDLIDNKTLGYLLNRGQHQAVAVSSLTGRGVDELLQKIKSYFMPLEPVSEVVIPIEDGKRLSCIYQSAKVIDRYEDDENIYLRIRAKKII